MKYKNSVPVLILSCILIVFSLRFSTENPGRESAQVNNSNLLKPQSTDSIQFIFCEGFTNPQFPPAGWTNSNSTLVYRVTQSGFVLGMGSAYFDFWNVAPGQTGDLITPVFTETVQGDSLALDVANCPFGGYDQVSINYSTNAGASYTLLDNLICNGCPPTPGCVRPFIPTSAGQWRRNSYVLPSGTNKIKFHGVSGFGDGIYIDSICILHPVGIVKNNNHIPATYSLYQNYPNPFNPTTKIKFDIPQLNPPFTGHPLGQGGQGGSVNLAIYDLLGREVATLVNEKLNPGTYEVEFDGTNYPSGVYIYKLTTLQYRDTKKMVLLK